MHAVSQVQLSTRETLTNDSCPQVVFFHRPSRMLITTDLFWDYPGHGVPWGTKAWKFGMDRVYAPFYNRCACVPTLQATCHGRNTGHSA